MRASVPFSLILLISCGPFFYQAPPPIAEYPERLATKRWEDLFTESSPGAPLLPDRKAMEESCLKLPETLKPMDTAARLAEIDRLIEINRGGDYSRLTANLLHECRELAADPALFDVSTHYLDWRVRNPSVSVTPLPSQKPWDMDEAEYAKARENHRNDLLLKRESFVRELATSPPALLPYWQVQQAAFEYRSREYQTAGRLFAAVVESHPNHPRAESAGLMHALCFLMQAREMRRTDSESGNLFQGDGVMESLDRSETLLNEYIAGHPTGRFTSDACGWLGAVALERDDLGLAVKHQLDRLERQQTREVLGSVLRECDSIFERLFARDEKEMSDEWLSDKHDFDAKSVARHPLVARLFVQHALDPAAAEMLDLRLDRGEPADRDTIEFLKKRTLRSQKWVATALRELGSELLLRNDPTDQTTLTVLAWSASGSGEHAQALALLDRVPAETARDEVLHARAIILQRLGRHKEAVAAFDLLNLNFPSSPLVEELPQRRSISLFHSGQAGLALVGLLESGVDPEDSDIGLSPGYYHPQWTDTILQFASLDQLATALPQLPEDHPAATTIRNVIRARALSAGDFPTARRYASPWNPAPSDEPDSQTSDTTLPEDAEWREDIAPLEDAMKLLNDPASNIDKPALHLIVALHWWKHRGNLTMPALEAAVYHDDEREKRELLRRQNGIQLGYGQEAVNKELDSRDEATHALAHALEAAKSTDPAVARAALELANECLFRRAEFSLYQLSRALERDDSRLSADLADRLNQLTRSKSAVKYDFQPIPGGWMPGDHSPSNSTNEILDILATGSSKPKLSESDEQAQWVRENAVLNKALSRVVPGMAMPEIRNLLSAEKLRQNELRKKMNPLDSLGIVTSVDRLDDLISAASLADITAVDFLNYRDERSHQLPASFKSFVDFRNRASIQASVDETDNDKTNAAIAGWKEYLDTWPDSPKAEAASLRLIRMVARQSRGRVAIGAFAFPEAPIPGGYKHVRLGGAWYKSDPEKILGMLAVHEQRFPDGRYRQDINLLKAECLIDKGRLSPALSLLLGILDDPLTGDLHPIAALDFCDINQRLLDSTQRDQVVTAFRENPDAFPRLKLLVHGDTFLSRLKPMMRWLESVIR
ncbi:hypothetical protein JIN84_04035 [Luteolibacter yonseiensis]|uniref:Tetratricopeptide repeat protein n=1 Tax=Luteolibacter yonseiensis TaxID=1144680 RepID=A0A934R101_9BACT|nr:hypothetical protein [Luteolibacter yonseiensis]MBK1814769.1 hypothetical protein [Luteolibacter yonseiensis]